MEERKSIALSFITLPSHIATHSHPALPIRALGPLCKAPGCHWSCAWAGVLQCPLEQPGSSKSPSPKDKWQKEKTFSLRLQTQPWYLRWQPRLPRCRSTGPSPGCASAPW